MFPLILKPGILGDKDTPSGGSPNALFIPLYFSLSPAPEGQPSREGGPEAVSLHVPIVLKVPFVLYGGHSWLSAAHGQYYYRGQRNGQGNPSQV